MLELRVVKQSENIKAKITEANSRISSLVNDKRQLEAKIATLEKSNADLQEKAENAAATQSPEEAAKQAAIVVRVCFICLPRFSYVFVDRFGGRER